MRPDARALLDELSREAPNGVVVESTTAGWLVRVGELSAAHADLREAASRLLRAFYDEQAAVADRLRQCSEGQRTSDGRAWCPRCAGWHYRSDPRVTRG